MNRGGGCECENIYIGDGKCICWKCGKETPLVSKPEKQDNRIMGLNKTSGDMYSWIDYTWNVIKGACSHDCSYCYMKRWGKLKPARFDAKELNTDLGKGNMIFVGSSNDMFAKDIPMDWIFAVLEHCEKFKDNKYVFQTKNPARVMGYFLPKNSTVGTTIETNRHSVLTKISKAPSPQERACGLSWMRDKTFVTIEPILDFDLKEMLFLIGMAHPDFVNLGADSKNRGLKEPTHWHQPATNPALPMRMDRGN